MLGVGLIAECKFGHVAYVFGGRGGSDIKVRYDAGTSNAERDNSDGKEETCAPQPAQARPPALSYIKIEHACSNI